MTVPLGQVTDALGLGTGGHVALVGGGGKSTLLHTLGRSMSGPTVLTSTTKMGTDQTHGLPVLIDPDDDELVEALARRSPVLVWSATEGTKALGVAPERCDHWFATHGNVVIEADGARHHPFKAPRSYEPVVPATVTHLLSVIGVDALGQPIVEGCHRPDVVAELAECSVDDPLTPARAAAVLLHANGARRELPVGAAFAVLITKVGINDASSAQAEELAVRLGEAEPGLMVVPVAFDPAVGATA